MVELIVAGVGLVLVICVVAMHFAQQKQANNYLEAIERHLRALRQVQAPQAKPGARWTCQACLKTNPLEMVTCGYCGAAKPEP